MSLTFRILQLEDSDKILQLEKALLAKSNDDPMMAEIESWTSPWRQESLNHYLPTGWCFGGFQRDKNNSESELKCYFIAQPLLFLSRQTQSLWVEHIYYENPKDGYEIFEIAWKLSREKHFQKVYFPKYIQSLNLSVIKVSDWDPQYVEIKTTKVN